MLHLVILYILSYTVITIIFLGVGLFSICRFLVGLYLSYKYKQPIEFVEGLDSVFCTDGENCRFLVGGCQIFKGRADIDKVRQRIDERWLQPRVNGEWKYGKLRKRLQRDSSYYFWLSQEEFRIENHVVLYDGPLPKNKDELQKFCAETLKNLPMSKGIYWQYVLVNLPYGLMTDSSDPHFILFIRFYHGLLDGISMNRMYRLTFDDPEIPEIRPNKISSIGLMDKVRYWVYGFVFGSYEFCCDVFKWREKHLLLGPKLTGTKFISFSDPIPLERIKFIKEKAKTTVNDVMVSGIVGGFRAYFLWKKEQIPRNLNIKIPVSFHNFQKEPTVSNNIAISSLDNLPVNEPNCVQRLLKMKTAMKIYKTSPYLPLAYLIMSSSFNRIPLFIMESFLSLISSTAIVSCFPFPRPKTFLGNESIAQNICFSESNGLSGCGMAVTVPSEGSTAIFAINADSGIIKSQENLDKLCEFMTKEIDELEKEFKKNGIKGS